MSGLRNSVKGSTFQKQVIFIDEEELNSTKVSPCDRLSEIYPYLNKEAPTIDHCLQLLESSNNKIEVFKEGDLYIYKKDKVATPVGPGHIRIIFDGAPKDTTISFLGKEYQDTTDTNRICVNFENLDNNPILAPITIKSSSKIINNTIIVSSGINPYGFSCLD